MYYLDRGFKNPVLLLHPLGGWTKDDDVPLKVINSHPTLQPPLKQIYCSYYRKYIVLFAFCKTWVLDKVPIS